MGHVVCPALRPGRGLLVRVPLDASPSLPNLLPDPVQIYFCAVRFVRLVLRCWVGGGAPCGAGLRPPLKLDVQISRIQLSQR